MAGMQGSGGGSYRCPQAGWSKGARMRIAVTGGCGFIGSHVVDHLVRAGHEVAGLDLRGRWQNSAAQYRYADIFGEAELAATIAGADAAFHLAGAADGNGVAADPGAASRRTGQAT